jgi:hypothetical protein
MKSDPEVFRQSTGLVHHKSRRRSGLAPSRSSRSLTLHPVSPKQHRSLATKVRLEAVYERRHRARSTGRQMPTPLSRFFRPFSAQRCKSIFRTRPKSRTEASLTDSLHCRLQSSTLLTVYSLQPLVGLFHPTRTRGVRTLQRFSLGAVGWCLHRPPLLSFLPCPKAGSATPGDFDHRIRKPAAPLSTSTPAPILSWAFRCRPAVHPTRK